MHQRVVDVLVAREAAAVHLDAQRADAHERRRDVRERVRALVHRPEALEAVRRDDAVQVRHLEPRELLAHDGDRPAGMHAAVVVDRDREGDDVAARAAEGEAALR